MAIRISRGTQPQSGRLTMPKGTFLSNPSTAADGELGGSSGMNPAPGWTGNLGYGTVNDGGMWWTPQNQNPNVPGGQWYSPIVNSFNQLNKNMENANQYLRGVQLWQPQQNGGFLGTMQQIASGQPLQPQSTYAFQASSKAAQSQYGDMPTVNDYGAVIPVNVANQVGAGEGKSPAEVAQQLIAAGFTQKWVEDLGQVWVKGTGPASAGAGNAFGGGGLDSRGRPEWVDGASLAPGEDVTDAQGNRYVGGTPAPDGTPQYALNLANPAARDDKKGRYKWVSTVRRDQNGNWIRINRQVLRKVYTRSHLKKKAAERAAQQPDASYQDTQNYNQLVNLRVNYG